MNGHPDPRKRLALGVLGLMATASVVRRDRVGPREQAAFRLVNGLPDPLHGPAWAVMQAGSLAAPPVAAAAACAAGRPRLARRLAASGVLTWLAAKLVKRVVQRPRPTALIADTHCRGNRPTGLGYVSGHAGVSLALAAAAWSDLGPRGRVAALAAVPVVGGSRMYVGAHLPLDVVGGAALGLAVDAIVTLADQLVDGSSREHP